VNIKHAAFQQGYDKPNFHNQFATFGKYSEIEKQK